ncbi:hypothetical protein J6S88_01625 [bacterium]|nr:hypothetical protein [bacterium]
MQVNGVFGNNTPDNRRVLSQNSISENGSIFLSFNDTDGKIDANDIQYSNDKAMELAAPYFAFLVSYCDGEHEWTPFMLEMVTRLIDSVNTAYENYNENYNITQTPFGGISLTDENGNSVLDVRAGNNSVTSITDYTNNTKTSIKKYADSSYITEYALDPDTKELAGTTSEKKYRQDESLYSVNETNGLKEIYNTSGQLYMRSYYQNTDEGRILVKEKYQDGNLRHKTTYNIAENGRERIQSRVVYENGQEITVTKYENNRVVSFTDNRITDNNKFFDETKLDGRFEGPIRQGLSGVCYMASIVNSMILSKNSQNLKDLNDVVTYDYEAGIATVKFLGLGCAYEIPLEDIDINMTRFGTNDPDFPAIGLAYEKYLIGEDGINIKEKPQAQPGSSFYMQIRDSIVDNHDPANFYYALTGKIMKSAKLSESDSFGKAKASLEKGGIVNAGTPPYNVNSSDKFLPSHNYAVIEIDEENDRVVLYEPNLEEYKEATIEEFKREFLVVFYT